MKALFVIPIITGLWCALSLTAQESPRSTAASPGGRAGLAATNASTGDYASDVGVVLAAQDQALEQARQVLGDGGDIRARTALEAAVKEMERSRAALEKAKRSPKELPAAIAAEQSAYQALLKATPREYRMTRSRNRSQGRSSSGQPSQQELNQLELEGEENRYETERQATATPTPQQREQAQTVDRLKQLARRQQDLNDRLRDLQTALQEARTEPEREEIQRQLKRLHDEERQLLSDVDELRQRLEQSPDAARQADARQQLDQTRTDVQRAAQELERQSVSEALAAGSRAEQNLQDLRENLRQQTSSQFAERMRQMRNQARDMTNQESQIARDLDALNNSEQKTLDDSSQRGSLVDQMSRQQSALTNLLGEMRVVTEQAEATEPLLSKQLYDILRRADQMHTDSQLKIGAQLVDRGFLPQASQAEHSARQNIDELRQSVDRAAESVLGSEAEALRYAQKELDDLARQVASEMSAGTNSPEGSASEGSGGQGLTNSLSKAQSRGANQTGRGPADTNSMASATPEARGRNGQTRGQDDSIQDRQPTGRDGESRQANSRRNSGQAQQSGNSSTGEDAASRNGQPGASAGSGEAQARDERNPSQNRQTSGSAGGTGERENQANSDQSQRAGNSSASRSVSAGEGEAVAGADAGNGERERLRQFAQQLGGGDGGLGLNGPITGNNYVDWSDRMRDVEQAVNSQDVRNQLATVRERVGVYRRAYRQDRRTPSKEELQNKVLTPLALARGWVGQELSRAQNERSLVPLDRDPVQEKYSDLVRQYYEKLGSPQ
jgi:hypothetical protein